MLMLFTGYHYYPGGGWNDFRGFFITEEDAKRVAKSQDGDWYQIVCPSDQGIGIISAGSISSID